MRLIRISFYEDSCFSLHKGLCRSLEVCSAIDIWHTLFQTTFFFFGNTKTHICIHLWTKICCMECASCRFEKHVSKRQRSCWLILASWPTEGKSGPFSNCVPDAAATFAIVNMSTTYLRYGGSISLKTKMFISLLHVIFATLQFSFGSTRSFQMSADPMTFDLKTYGGLGLWVIKPKNIYTDFDLNHIRRLQQECIHSDMMSLTQAASIMKSIWNGEKKKQIHKYFLSSCPIDSNVNNKRAFESNYLKYYQ